MLKPLYGQAPPGLRAQMLLEFRTEAAEIIDRECRGGKLARQRKKVQEWLSADPATLTKDAIRELWEVIAGVFQIQTIILGESESRHTEISFAPTAVSAWRADRPIHVVDKSLGAVWVYVGDRMMLLREIGHWLSGAELAGETVCWPTAAGDKTKAELVEFLEILPTWRAEYAKRKKDDLAEMAGRAQCVEMFARWAEGNMEYLED